MITPRAVFFAERTFDSCSLWGSVARSADSVEEILAADTEAARKAHRSLV